MELVSLGGFVLGFSKFVEDNQRGLQLRDDLRDDSSVLTSNV